MSQLQALVGLRWRMVRSPRARWGLLALAGLMPALLVLAVLVGQLLPATDRRFELSLLAPSSYLVFAVLAIVAPLVTGGGNELFPEEQLLAYPVRPQTVFQGGLLMAPLNLAWTVQVVGLAGITAVGAARGGGVALACLTLVAYVSFVTVTGQALAWAVVGVRHHRLGRVLTRTGGVLTAVLLVVLIVSGRAGPLLDSAPTTRVVVAAIQGSQGSVGPWLACTLVLVLGTLVAARCGEATCRWALRQPRHATGRPELAPVSRRAARGSAFRELVAVDRASVWRSTSLRRGTLVLAALPGSVAVLAEPTWSSLAMLPGLVAAGAGLLFGVNAFCLDGAGACWVASQPHDARATLLSKLVVIGQTCGAAVLLALLVAGTRLREPPTSAELVSVLGSAAAAVAVVVALCARLSVEHPHKADLRGPRDTPAPPATMAVYSLRLALATTWPGLVLTGTAVSGSSAAAFLTVFAVLALAGRTIARTVRMWDDPSRRGRVVTTVSYG